MAAVALIKLSQDPLFGDPGEALIGDLFDVDVENSDNTDVASWQIDLIWVPPTSALVPGTLAFSDNGSTPLATFSPDAVGSFRIQLTVWGAINRTGTYDTDIRVFAVRGTGRGFVKPPAQIWPLALPPEESSYPRAKPNEMNFEGQPNGWSGVPGSGLLDDVLDHVEQTGILTSSAPVAVTKATAVIGTSDETARADHKHDISTAAASTIGTANSEGSATSLARSDHGHDHGSQSTGTHHAVASSVLNGFMVATDKVLLDSLVKSIKQPVRVATTANITLSNTQTIDGVAVVAGDRVLVKDQTTGANNGIYVVAAGAWSRAVDFDASAEVASGTLVTISEGTNADYIARLSTNDPITIGSTALTFLVAPPPRVISPSSLSTDQNDYTPTGWDAADVVRLTVSAPINITGFAAPSATGTVRKQIRNTSTTETITLTHNSGSSVTANRIVCPNSWSYRLLPRSGVDIYYDATATDWRLVSADVFVPTIITPTSLSADQNDYAPTGWDSADVVRMTVTTNNYSITGFAAPTSATSAYRKLFINGDSSEFIFLIHNSSSSTVGNRILCPNNAPSIRVAPRCAVYLEYDFTSTQWRLITLNHEVAPVIISTGNVTSNQNDYAPTGWDNADIVRIQFDLTQQITGFAAPTTVGTRRKYLVNIDGNDRGIIRSNSSSSTAGNRVLTPLARDFVLEPRATALIWYDDSSTAWRLLSSTESVVPRIYYPDECFNTTGTSSFSNYGNFGSGSLSNPTSSGRPGLVSMLTSASGAASSGGYMVTGSLTDGPLIDGMRYACSIITPSSFTSTNTSLFMRAGMFNNLTASTPGRGAWFEYSGSGSLSSKTKESSTTTNTLATLSTSTAYNLVMEVYLAGNGVRFYLFSDAGALLAETDHTANLPTSSAYYGIIAGTIAADATFQSSITLTVDWQEYSFSFDGRRMH